MGIASKIEKDFIIEDIVLKSQIESLRNLLEKNILLYGTSDKRVLIISQQLDNILNSYTPLYY